jgi:hypothetical protein
MSAVESITNISVGVVIALISQIVIFQLYGIPVNLKQNVEMTAWFTVISFARSYILRRVFNKIKG